MHIAIQTRDLDHNRVDGTRVYLWQLLKRFGALRPDIFFTLYHRDEYNEKLAPPQERNYTEKKIAGKLAWMQTGFAKEIFRTRPDKVFLPLQAAPFFFPRKVEITATIHDLAFRFYPETFPTWDRLKLRIFLRVLLWRAKKIICVSHATKRDLMHFFPKLSPSRVRVIHHGFDGEFFTARVDDEERKKTLSQWGLESQKYLLYVGALQPRKNIVRVVEAFEKLKALPAYSQYQLVLAGEAAWLSEGILERIAESMVKEDIVQTGSVPFADLRALYQETALFVFPSLYEGFGLPVLEAFAAGATVLVSENSSLREVAGDGAWYCDAFSSNDIARQMQCVLENPELRSRLREHQASQLQKFSWETSAQKTLDFILE
jgi:glycosyltransferase involved in cell wall biosynthesis